MKPTVRLGCVLGVILILLSGCLQSDSLVLAPQDSADQAATSPSDFSSQLPGSVTKPFRGFYTTTFTAPLTPPPILEFEIWGEGTATLLGASTWFGPSSVDLTQIPPTQFSLAVFTAADGSQITMTATGITGPGPDAVYDVAFEGSFTLSDGTGRLAGATGSGSYAGIASNSLAIGEIRYDGTITTPRPPSPPPGRAY